MSLNKNIILISFLLHRTLLSAEQGYKICGKVKCEDGDARDVQVIIKNTNYRVIADSLGYFCIENVPKGSYRILAFAEKHTVEFIDVELSNDITINFDLHPENIHQLSQIEIAYKKQNTFGISFMNSIEKMGIYEGKKTEVIHMDALAHNASTNNARQAFAKVSGLTIWESDYAGLQLGIGARGLSPNRSSNFNVRQNGYEIAADPLGYPESYYTPPLEATEKIEFVRGAGALQYGTQLGGMVNFVIKKGISDKKFEIVNRLTGGSYGYFANFLSFGGQFNKINYYSFYQFKRGDGWRPNAKFYSHNFYHSYEYEYNEKNKVILNYTHFNYLAQQPGGLSDQDFTINPRKSTRQRNWFKVNWNLISVAWNHKFSTETELEWKTFSLLGSKFAIGAQEKINIPDQMANRVLQKDYFANLGSEVKLLTRYRLLGQNSAFLLGVRGYKGQTIRQQGEGSSEYHANFKFNNPQNLEKFDYLLPTYNFAAFVENIFKIGSRWRVVPGVRAEYINMQSKGYTREILKNFAGDVLLDKKRYYNKSNQRKLVLMGISSSYQIQDNAQLYSSYTQNFRAATFSDIIVSNPSIIVDSLLADERGSNTDLGFRSTLSDWLYIDASFFILSYSGKIGEIYTLKGDRFRTNVGNSRTYGFEFFSEFDLFKRFNLSSSLGSFSYFINYSFNRARYISSNHELFNNSYVGNRVEMVPAFTCRMGLSYKFRNLNCSIQFTKIGNQYTDATNAVGPVLGSHIGLVPGYHVYDLTIKYTFKKIYSMDFSINNLTNQKYFTRRAEGYPGPGIIPADPRLFYATLGVKI